MYFRMFETVSLSYGKGKIPIKIPTSNFGGFISPALPKERLSAELALEKTLQETPLKIEDITRNKKVCVTVEDYTRVEPHWELISAISKRLVDALEVQYIVATGTHNPNDKRNIAIKDMIDQIANSFGVKFRSSLNDSRAVNDFYYAGVTSRGTDVFASKASLDSDLFITIADMKPHYFAGYSAANKHFLPGICSFETTRINHCRLIKDERSNYGRHPWHYNVSRSENPLASDMIEAVELIANGRPVFTLATISEGDIFWSKIGTIGDVTRAGIQEVDKIYSFSVKPTNYLIVSPGGFPEDSYLYSGQRALELTSEAVNPGGNVLWISECSLGIHTGVNQQEVDDFYNAMLKDQNQLSEELDKADVKFHTYKAYRFKRLLSRIHIYGYSSLQSSILESIGMIPVQDPQSTVDRWLSEDPDARILVVDRANKLAVYGDKDMEG